MSQEGGATPRAGAPPLHLPQPTEEDQVASGGVLAAEALDTAGVRSTARPARRAFRQPPTHLFRSQMISGLGLPSARQVK